MPCINKKIFISQTNVDTKTQPKELDMRVHVPIERHRKLIQLFKELAVYESFIFINDQYPIPLF